MVRHDSSAAMGDLCAYLVCALPVILGSTLAAIVHGAAEPASAQIRSFGSTGGILCDAKGAILTY